MPTSPRAKKLRLHTARRALILNAPEHYLETLGEVPAGITTKQKPTGEFDFAHLFVKNRKDLDRFIDWVFQAIRYDAILWISYPKGTSGVETELV